MPRGGFRYKREFTPQELALILNASIPVTTLETLVNASGPTIKRVRKENGVETIRGKRPGVDIDKWETRKCANPNCSSTFSLRKVQKKKYCSRSCQMIVDNNGPKGKGTRKLRNPNMPEYKRYARMVHGLSRDVYKENIDLINPNRYPRTLCGVEGGWQLDHIIPIKECFEKGLSVEEASHVSNLRMLPWKENLMRQYKNV